MKKISYISYILASLCMMLLVACHTDVPSNKFALSCGDTFTIGEGDTEMIEVVAGGNYTIATSNKNARCTISGSNIEVKGVKVGDCLLTVTAESGEQLTCTITIEKSAAQKDFLIYSAFRIENWQDSTVYVDEALGLQVTYEKNTDVAGYNSLGTTTLGYYFVESGAFCRLSAPIDFCEKGDYQGGIVAIGDGNNDTRYYLCENVSVVKVIQNKAWVVASMNARADLRLVVQLY